MFFQLRELLRWLGLTVFEILVALVCFTVFTVLLTLKVEGGSLFASSDLSGPAGPQTWLTWWTVFAPLFVNDALNSYFCIIVFFRMYLEVPGRRRDLSGIADSLGLTLSISPLQGSYKAAFVRVLWSLIMLSLLLIFKYLLCQKLGGDTSLEYSEVMSPVFILLQLVMIRACQLQ